MKQQRFISAILTLMAVPLLAAPAFAGGSNRIGGFDVLGKGRIQVTMAGGKAAKVDITMPAANVTLNCNKSGYRPSAVRYGVVPLSFGLQRGHARGQAWKAANEKKGTRVVKFPAGPIFAKTSANRDPLKPMRTQAINICAKGGAGGDVTVRLDVEATCRRVSMGFGKKTNDYSTGRPVAFAVVCVGNAPAKKKPKSSQRGRASRRGRN